MESLRQYLREHGRPMALYTDRHGIFWVNRGERDGALTQWLCVKGPTPYVTHDA